MVWEWGGEGLPDDERPEGPTLACAFLQGHLVERILVGEGLRTLSTLGDCVETPRAHFPPLPRATPKDSYPDMDMDMDMGMDMGMGPAVAGQQ